MGHILDDIRTVLIGDGAHPDAADADMQKVLDRLDQLAGKPIEKLDVEQARQQPTAADAVVALLREQGKDVSPTRLVPGISSVDVEIPGAVGMLPARVYTPKGDGPFPVVAYFHGGGWVLADKDTYDAGARGLSKAANAVVVSIDYRQAPEAKFPAAWDDALAAYKWLGENAPSVNGVPGLLALAGESAGGNLALATALAARDAGAVPPQAIVAVCPIGQTGNMFMESYLDSRDAKPLNKAMIDWFFDKLLDNDAQRRDPRLDLVNADLGGLPPVTLINAEIDPLRTDGEMLETALREEDVEVTRMIYDGVTHEFFGMAPVVGKARRAQEFAGKQLRKAFRTSQTTH